MDEPTWLDYMRSQMLFKKITQKKLAKILRINVSTLSSKMCRRKIFNEDELRIIFDVLDFSDEWIVKCMRATI